MIIAGPCLYINDPSEVWETALALKNVVDIFRCKIYGGGTTPQKYINPKDEQRLELLVKINKEIMPVITEIHIPEQAYKLQSLGIKSLWIGARNSANYSLLEKISPFNGNIIIKRGPSMTIDEFIGIYDIMKMINNRKVYLIERGINTFDRLENSRWSLDLKGIIRIKHERPEIFEELIVDVSHSVGVKAWIEDHYKACKAIGIKHFMIECTLSGKSKTDSLQMLSFKELKNIIGG